MKISVGVFFGGKSTEHEVSVISAIQAMENMDQDRYRIIPIYISKDERFYYGDQLRSIDNYKNMDNLLASLKEISLVKSGDKVYLYSLPIKVFPKKLDEIEVLFPILHGNKGENGSIQGYFEILNLPYVGSGVAASAIGMDKVLAKQIARANGLEVVESISFTKQDYLEKPDQIINWCEQRISYPMILKPASGGSSIGIEIVSQAEDLAYKIDNVLALDMKVIVERKIEIEKELNCSVIGDAGQVQVSVVEEPVSADEILSFDEKYLNSSKKGMSSATRIIPADIDRASQMLIEDYSKTLFRAMGNLGVVRIDYIMEKNTKKIYFNEINTIPGSLSFYLWDKTGLKYKELLNKLINMAIKTHKDKEQYNYSFKSNIFESSDLLKGGLKK